MLVLKEMLQVFQPPLLITVIMELLFLLLTTEKIRTIMEKLQYPQLNVFVISQKEKFEKSKKKLTNKSISTYFLESQVYSLCPLISFEIIFFNLCLLIFMAHFQNVLYV